MRKNGIHYNRLGWVTFVIWTVLFLGVTWAGAVTYEYDELNRVTRVLYDNGMMIEYTYDAAGNIIAVETTSPPDIASYPSFRLIHFEVRVGSSSTKTVTIFNRGDRPLEISSIEIVPGSPFRPVDAAQFSQTNTCSIIPPAGSCAIFVTFKPTVRGHWNARMEIASNDPDENPFLLNIMAVGIDGRWHK